MAQRATLVVSLALLTVVFSSLGFIKISILTDGVKLWVPQNSQAMENEVTVDSAFGAPQSFSRILVESVVDDMLSPEVRTLHALSAYHLF